MNYLYFDTHCRVPSPIHCVSIKSLHFSKVPHINILQYFQEISIDLGSYGLFYQMIPTSLTILYAWVNRSHICKIDQNPGLTGSGIWFCCYQQDWESWKGFEIIILMVWWHFMKEHALLCVYSDICHRHFMLHRAINYFIERFGYILVCSVINAVISNVVNHQKVTKTLNNVINSSMQHKMSMVYVRIYTQ